MREALNEQGDGEEKGIGPIFSAVLSREVYAVCFVAAFIRTSQGGAAHSGRSVKDRFRWRGLRAGRGNYWTFGICIFPEVGTRAKVTGIITEAELPLDPPRNWNIEEFCSRCRSCQKTCPAGAIPKHEKRFRGMLKRQTYH